MEETINRSIEEAIPKLEEKADEKLKKMTKDMAVMSQNVEKVH